MRDETSYVVIGVFVIAGMVLLAAGLAALGVARGREVIAAETYFEESVSGLEAGAPVRFRGVTMGRVQRISAAPALYQEEGEPFAVVRFTLWSEQPDVYAVHELRAAFEERIGEGLRVRLASSGLTGVAYLELDLLEKSKVATAEPPIERDDDVLYIPSAPSDLSRVVDSLETVLGKLEESDVEELVANASDAFAGAADLLRRTDLGELQDEAMAAIRAARAEIEGAKLAEAGRRANEVMARAEALIDDLSTRGSRTLDTTTGAAERVDAAAAAVEELFTNIRAEELVSNLERASSSLAATADAAQVAIGDLRALVAGRSRQINALLADAGRIAADLRSLLATAKAYPSWLLFGEAPPRRSGR